MNHPISSMTTAEKLEAMEQLWASLQSQSDEFSPPEWHRQVLAERQTRLDRGETTFSSLDEVRDRLGKRES
ncbi:MAG TPA: addiction module protein [Pirellulaceae bacterium]|nr:addiction module protein [Pirellulaceae bacterium]